MLILCIKVSNIFCPQTGIRCSNPSLFPFKPWGLALRVAHHSLTFMHEPTGGFMPNVTVR